MVMNYKLCEENKTLLPFMGHKFLLPFLEISSFSNLVPFEECEDAIVDYLVAESTE